MRAFARFAFAPLVALLLTGCSAFVRQPNRPIDQIDLATGHRPVDATRHRDAGRIWARLFFSGGGTRAASFAYGVLEGLRDVSIVVDGEERRLLDEVDSLSGVSGGSFPAAYYGLFGERIFEDFEDRFLKRHVQRALVVRTLLPWNLVRVLTPFLSRSDLASRYYDKHVFEGATFADLTAAEGPRVYINATDVGSGAAFRFTQSSFDVICSDLDAMPISFAVAASSAVPGLLSPLTLRNYAGRCGFEPPEWFEETLGDRHSNPLGYESAARIAPFLDASQKPYIHLIDGAISDNLGLRPGMERLAMIGDADEALEISNIEAPDHIVHIVVNAETTPNPIIDLSAAAPSLVSLLNSVTGAQIRRANFDTLLLAEAFLHEFGEDLSTPEHQVRTHFIEVGFDMLQDPEERSWFNRLPTSFVLKRDEVDKLREAGRSLLLESPEFQTFVDMVQ